MFSVSALSTFQLKVYHNMATPGDEVEASNDLTDGEADKHPSGTTSGVEGHQVEVRS